MFVLGKKEELSPAVQLPAKLAEVFEGPADVRGAYGGRGSAKTRTFAKMTAVRALMWDQMGREGVIVCGREHLNSLDDSSMAEVKLAIQSEPWLAREFDIGEKYIRTKSKRISYKFSGMEKKTVMSLKSKARILLLWADEAEPITDAAWDIVLPTLREEDSELWVTWNPMRKSSATDRRFRQTKDPRFKVVELNWRDNPWFPKILERQRLRWLENDPDSYDHVWEGAYATAVKGAYFTKQLSAMRREGRLCRVAADPLMTYRLFCDIGGTGRNSDAFSMWGAQFIGREVRVLDYYEQVGQAVGHHLIWMRDHGYQPNNTGIWLPHDGATKDKVYSVSYQSAFEAADYPVEVVPNQGHGAAVARINSLRRIFPAIWMNDSTTQSGVEALGWYHEKWDDERDVGLGPEHDWASHGCIDGDSIVSTARGNIAIRDVVVGDMVETPAGYAHVSFSGMTKIATEIVEMTLIDGSVLIMTPEHKVFTTRGVIAADALRYNDAVFTMESAPCLPYQEIKSAGYRDALIESFKEKNTGYGQKEGFTQVKSGANNVYCILRFIAQYMASLRLGQKLSALMVTCAISIQTTGSSSAKLWTGCTKFRKKMGSGSITSQRDTTKLTMKGTEESPCTDMSGKSTTESSQQACTFTTLMVTSRTTALAIWSYLLQAITAFTMAAQTNGLEAKQTSNKSSVLVKLLRRGIQALMDLLGIHGMGKNLGKTGQQPLSSAASAEITTKPSIRGSQSSVVKIAKLRLCTGEAARRPVYDLTVDHQHCYIANGVLVSNSDAAGLMAIVAEDAMRPGQGVRRDKAFRRSGSPLAT